MESSHVLVVDDDPSVRRLVAAVLERRGYDVDQVADGAQAIERMEAEHYDALVLDLMMPIVSGAEVLDYIEKKNEPMMSRTIVLSAATPSYVKSVTQNRPCRVIGKPFDIASLVEVVEACLEECGNHPDRSAD